MISKNLAQTIFKGQGIYDKDKLQINVTMYNYILQTNKSKKYQLLTPHPNVRVITETSKSKPWLYHGVVLLCIFTNVPTKYEFPISGSF